jgi:uncharacterized protein
MLSPELLQLLCCPETHQALTLVETPLLEQINARIAAGGLRNRAGHTVTDRLDGGLLRADGQVVYPIRSEIPVLLIDEGIPLTA